MGLSWYCLVQLTLTVYYTEGYPDELPQLTLEAIKGELDDNELKLLMDELQTVVCAIKYHGSYSD